MTAAIRSLMIHVFHSKKCDHSDQGYSAVHSSGYNYYALESGSNV